MSICTRLKIHDGPIISPSEYSIHSLNTTSGLFSGLILRHVGSEHRRLSLVPEHVQLSNLVNFSKLRPHMKQRSWVDGAGKLKGSAWQKAEWQEKEDLPVQDLHVQGLQPIAYLPESASGGALWFQWHRQVSHIGTQSLKRKPCELLLANTDFFF